MVWMIVLWGCVSGRMRDAASYMEQQRYPAAAAAYGDVLSKRPDRLDALLGQASALLAADRPEAALAPAERAAGRGAPAGIALYARALLAVGRGDEAVSLLRTDDEIPDDEIPDDEIPDDEIPDGPRLLVEALLVAGAHDAALRIAREHSAEHPGPWAWAAMRAGAVSEAQSAGYAATLSEDEDARADGAAVLSALGVEASVDISEDAVTRWWTAAGRLEAGGDAEGVLRQLSRLAAAQPKDVAVLRRLGQQWLALDAPQPARRVIEMALEADPQQPDLWLVLSRICAQLKQPRCEGAALEGRLIYSPDAPIEDWVRAGSIWESLGEGERWVGLWGLAVTRRPGDPTAQYHLARALQALGRIDEAVGHARLSWQASAGDAEVALLLGELYEIRREFRAAAALYREAISLHPADQRLISRLETVLGYVYR
ncbi:MAG: tetratricopeptide repeat protein [Myxococcota bacterium]